MTDKEGEIITITIKGTGIDIKKEITQEQAGKIIATALEPKKPDKKIGVIIYEQRRTIF